MFLISNCNEYTVAYFSDDPCKKSPCHLIYTQAPSGTSIAPLLRAMNQIIIIFTLLFIATLSTLAKGQETIKKQLEEKQPVLETKQTHLSFGFTYKHFNYNEDVNPPAKSSELGNTPGFEIAINHRFSNNKNSLEGKGVLDFASGATAYDGSLQNSDTNEITPYKSTTNNKFFNLEGDLIQTFSAANENTSFLKGYAGLGIHTWERVLGGAGGYTEQYSWVYLPIGIQFVQRASENFTLTLDGSIKLMFGGYLRANLSQASSNYNDVEMKLGDKPGFKFQAPLDYRFASNYHFIATPWYEYSEIGKSDSVLGGISSSGPILVSEPNSKTTSFGADLAFSVDF